MSRPLLTKWFPIATRPVRIGWYDVNQSPFFEDISGSVTKRYYWRDGVWATGARGADKTVHFSIGYWRGKATPT